MYAFLSSKVCYNVTRFFFRNILYVFLQQNNKKNFENHSKLIAIEPYQL